MNYYAVQRSTDHLAHYGVKGMKWGVRKAIELGDSRALDRHYRKAAKKLRKLQKIGLGAKKNAAKAAAYGAGAAALGTLAVGGPEFTKRYLANNANLKMVNSLLPYMEDKEFINSLARYGIENNSPSSTNPNFKRRNKAKIKSAEESLGNVKQQLKVADVVNSDLARIGTGVAAAGLGALAAKNAYRATHAAKYREKALDWQKQMDDTFKGTKYAGQYAVPRRRRRSR